MHAALAHADLSRRTAARIGCAMTITTIRTTTTGTGTRWWMRLGVVD
jgi:hypothetical protein